MQYITGALGAVVGAFQGAKQGWSGAQQAQQPNSLVGQQVEKVYGSGSSSSGGSGGSGGIVEASIFQNMFGSQNAVPSSGAAASRSSSLFDREVGVPTEQVAFPSPSPEAPATPLSGPIELQHVKGVSSNALQLLETAGEAALPMHIRVKLARERMTAQQTQQLSQLQTQVQQQKDAQAREQPQTNPKKPKSPKKYKSSWEQRLAEEEARQEREEAIRRKLDAETYEIPVEDMFKTSLQKAFMGKAGVSTMQAQAQAPVAMQAPALAPVAMQAPVPAAAPPENKFGALLAGPAWQNPSPSIADLEMILNLAPKAPKEKPLDFPKPAKAKSPTIIMEGEDAEHTHTSYVPDCKVCIQKYLAGEFDMQSM